MSGPPSAVLWFRRDLRLHDLPALHAAMRDGRDLMPLFVFDPALLDGRWSSANRMWFLAESVRELASALARRGAPMVIRVGDPRTIVPELAAAVGASSVFVSRDYSPYARRRDSAVARALAAKGVSFHACRGTLAVEPEQVAALGVAPRSYSQFKKRWGTFAVAEPLPVPDNIRGLAHPALSDPVPTARTTASSSLAPGEAAALGRLDAWARSGATGYAASRDFPADERGSSRLSQDLRFGLLSPNQVIAALRASPGPGTEKFVAEMAWREFYAHLLWREPRVLHEPLESRFGAFPWRDEADALSAWEHGETGFPIVDAGMRQLVETGYMHNRVRMVAASFLVKDLLIDWRHGEAFFMRHLFDGDPASNSGGWQWVAGCGADASPFFRIFNPVIQGKKFDRDGAYVRRWLPVLRRLPEEFVHEPWTMPVDVQHEARCIIGTDYPAPIIDHHAGRERALAAFASITTKKG